MKESSVATETASMNTCRFWGIDGNNEVKFPALALLRQHKAMTHRFVFSLRDNGDRQGNRVVVHKCKDHTCAAGRTYIHLYVKRPAPRITCPCITVETGPATKAQFSFNLSLDCTKHLRNTQKPGLLWSMWTADIWSTFHFDMIIGLIQISRTYSL